MRFHILESLHDIYSLFNICDLTINIGLSFDYTTCSSHISLLKKAFSSIARGHDGKKKKKKQYQLQYFTNK